MSWTACPEPETKAARPSATVTAVIVPRMVDVGEMQVGRALPSRNAQMVGPFIFFDQMGPAQFNSGSGLDVRPHPHINLATLTYLFDGEMLHRDSLGNRQPITPGAVNWMRAGSGIVHSERSSEESRAHVQSLHGIQTWVALPESAEEADPEFTHHGAGALPIIEDKGSRARLVAGEAYGAASPLRTESATLYVDMQLAANSKIPVPDEYVERALYVVKGEIDVSGDRFSAGRLLILGPGRGVSLLACRESRVLLFGGEPMDGPRFIWWNFVSSRKERIEQAKEDWEKRRFADVADDSKEHIPLPKNKTSPRLIAAGSKVA